MRSNTALKIEHTEEVQVSAEIFDLNKLASIQIAVQAEQAANLPGNQNDCDYEEFMSRYGITKAFA